ncbi:hypothetical protein G7072_06780 [Nocardioides sp. HDW12B]|uniref:hypothetical protein n=1 Tax=Nocardioides sp. HDW12B TaxID=2714939 RepID=UPI00140E307D|nr:hypothetical protein [Nocardioides sp. HDW12B]QIK66086.1 hypothetical protein G7072_06780 [Nocardioides sp. HDW12B]
MTAPEDTPGDQPGHQSGDQPDGPEVGTVAEEAAKLMGALSGWAREQGDTAAGGAAASVAGLADLAKDLEGHVAGENCTYCPVCRVIGMVRATSPEVKAHLTTATTSLLQAAMSAMATPVPDEARRRQAGVEKIDLEDDDQPGWD